jgi:hypothetical protein
VDETPNTRALRSRKHGWQFDLSTSFYLSRRVLVSAIGHAALAGSAVHRFAKSASARPTSSDPDQPRGGGGDPTPS